MKKVHGLASLAALQIRIDHLPHNRPGPDNRHLHDYVVKTFGPQARQTGHLRMTFHLEHSDRVCFLERGINDGIIRGQTS